MPEVSGVFVVCMGMGTVFVGLIASILIGMNKNEPEKTVIPTPAPVPATPAAAPVPSEIPNRAEFVAAVSAAIAEDLGTDVSKIQIISIKQI